MRFKNPNRSRITKNKIAALFDRIIRRNSERDRGSIFDILTDLFIEFKRFFTKAKSPRFQFSPLIKGDVVVAEKYNDTILDAMEDLSVCTDETSAIKPIVIGSYNAARQMGKELENRSEVALSKITDVRLFQGQLGQEVLVVGDDFQNTKKVDGAFALSAPSADVRTSDGLVTLNRIESINLVDGGTKVVCEPLAPSSILTEAAGGFYVDESATNQGGAALQPAPAVGGPVGTPTALPPTPLGSFGGIVGSLGITIPGRNSGLGGFGGWFGNQSNTTFAGMGILGGMRIPGGTPAPQPAPPPIGIVGGIPRTDNINRYYEGNFYNFMGQARPEGGQWHLDERPYKITDSQLNSTQTIDTTNEPFDPTQQDGYIPGTAMRPQDLLLFDRGASEAEKNAVRRRMFDENSASFWEAEYVKKIGSRRRYKRWFGAAMGSTLGSPDINTAEFSLDELRELAIQKDTEDFEIQITVDLGRVKPVSWVSLEPINFGETAWMEVTDVSTAGAESQGFRTIPGMYKHRFANVLTDEANEELQADIAVQVLAPDRYSFRGKGVFSFPMTFSRYVRLKIIQKVPVPALYQRLSVQMVREIDTTVVVTTKKKRFLRSTKKTKKTTKSKTLISRVVKLNYLQTIAIYNQSNTVDDFSPETLANTHAAGSSSTRRGSAGWLGVGAAAAAGGAAAAGAAALTGLAIVAAPVAIIAGVIAAIFGSKTTRSTKTTQKDSGWSIAKQWLEVNYDKIRYAIGIRELSIFNYRFSPTSELVSKRFSTPKEIIKAQLEVVEEIPAEFSPEMRYIEYYISFNDGDWHRINPTGHPTLYSNEGNVVPEILTVNFETSGPGGSTTIKAITTEMPAKQVRLKAVMKNDPSLGNAEYYTPVLKKYRVKLVPKTSLSRG